MTARRQCSMYHTLNAMGTEEADMKQQMQKKKKTQHNKIPISHRCDFNFMEQAGTLLLWETMFS